MSSTAQGDTPENAREFNFSQRDFERVRKMIYERVGIVLADHKQDMVYSRLARRLRTIGMESFHEYLDLLASDDTEMQAFTNALTTNLTSFFREPHHFESLKEHLGKIRGRSRVAIWSSAASTGEEPYSIAMTCAEFYDSLRPPVTILATDVDTQVLAHGERGVYGLDAVQRLGPQRCKRFFLRGTGANEGYCRVVEPLRELISFRQLNLLDAQWPMREQFDAIFCRNVMIYFDKPTQLSILRKMMPLLAADGLFFAGHSESFFHAGELIRSVGRTVYVHATTRGTQAAS